MAKLDFDATAFPQPAQSADPMHYFNQIDNDNPDPALVSQYLHALHAQASAQGTQCVPVERFYNNKSLDMWRSMWRERPEGVQVPTHVDLLQIKSILFNALIPFHCNVTDMDCITMEDRLVRADKILCAWLAENNVQKETPEQKRARYNREAQRRLALRAKNDGSPECEHAKALKVAYDAYMLACRQRKEAEVQWAQYVASKKAEYEAIKAQKPLN